MLLIRVTILTVLIMIASGFRNSIFNHVRRVKSPVRLMASDQSKHLILEYAYVADILERRGPHRSKHLEIAENLRIQGKLVAAGPINESLSAFPCGAIFVFHGSLDDVNSFVEQDPYVLNNLVTKHSIREWTVVVGKL